jgi:hypothetical protein
MTNSDEPTIPVTVNVPRSVFDGVRAKTKSTAEELEAHAARWADGSFSNLALRCAVLAAVLRTPEPVTPVTKDTKPGTRIRLHGNSGTGVFVGPSPVNRYRFVYLGYDDSDAAGTSTWTGWEEVPS